MAMNLSKIASTLRNAPHNCRARSVQDMEDALRAIKEEAVARGDEARAKKVWCLEETLRGQTLYVSAFDKMKRGNYYPAWCELERVEITLGFLWPHSGGRWREFHLDAIAKHTKQFQSLFPYKLFISPEMIYSGLMCTICRQPISVRRSCGHRTGEIYNGEMCGREITGIERSPGVALVTSPAQKYSVLFVGGEDTHNYSMVRYAIERLESPFDGWTCHWTKARHPHSRYGQVAAEAACPCESGRTYRECCQDEDGVLRPHCDIDFAKKPSLSSPLRYF